MMMVRHVWLWYTMCDMIFTPPYSVSLYVFRQQLQYEWIVPRPYRVPFGTFGCILFVSPACALCFFLMAIGSKLTYIYFCFLCVFGMFFHILQKTAKHYKWWEYVEAPPKKRKVSSPAIPKTGGNQQ